MFIFHIVSAMYVFNMVSERLYSFPAPIWSTSIVAFLYMLVFSVRTTPKFSAIPPQKILDKPDLGVF